MAYNPFRIYRIPNTLKDKEAEHLRQTRDAVARCIDILKAHCPIRSREGSLRSLFQRKRKARALVGARACATGKLSLMRQAGGARHISCMAS